MRNLTGILAALLVMSLSQLSAQTVTAYSRHTPVDYQHSNTRFGNYPGSYFAPRIEWARPFVGGRLNLLLFLPMDAARESVELASRIDAHVEIITSRRDQIWWDTGPGGDGFYCDIPSEQALNERARMLLSPAYQYHAIIIGKVKWSVIPEDIRQKILERVKGGVALILVSPLDVGADVQRTMQLTSDNALAESVRSTVPLAKLPLDLDLETLHPDTKAFTPRKIGPLEIQAGKVGEGTVVFLRYNDLLLKNGKDASTYGYPYSYYVRQLGLTPSVGIEDDDLFYNYYYSILSKAIVHAAGKTSTVSVRPDPVDAEIGRGALPAAPITFRIVSEHRIPSETTVYYEIRDRKNHVLAQGEEEIASHDGAVAFSPRFPVLKQGLYLVDAWVKRRGRVVDWASTALTVTDTRYLASVAADKPFFRRDEGISGTIAFSTPVPAGHQVVVKLWDTYNRLEQRVEVPRGETRFRFARIPYPLSRTYRIVCQVLSGGVVLDEQETWTGLPSNDIDEFQFLVDGGSPTTRVHKTYLTLFHEFGITGFDDEHYWSSPTWFQQSADNLARNNFKVAFHVWHMGGFKVGDPSQYSGTGRIGDFQSNTWKDGHREYYRPRIEAYKRYGTLYYGVNNESGVEGGEWNNPAALNDYRIYLQERYGDINTLNTTWGSAFNSFDDIVMISFLDARTRNQSTRWLDQKLYKFDRYSRVHEYCASLIKEYDPGARVGVAITQLQDYDIPRMAKNGFSFVQSYLEHFDKENTDRISAGYYVGFYQGEQSEWHMRTKAWESLFRGGNAICWWPIHNTFTKDLSEPFLCFQQMAEEVRGIHSGVDRLLLSSHKRIDPILILWSNRSQIAGVYHPQEMAWLSAVEAFTNMLRRVGMDYQCVGEDFVEDQLQFSPQQRVLILPASQSISRKGVERIKAFAAAGGLVIADYRPAVMDEYLRPYGEDPNAPKGTVDFETCPRCKGKKVIHLGGAGDPLGACTTCGGTGVVAKGGAINSTRSALDEVFDFTGTSARPYGKGYGLFLAGAPAVNDWRALRQTLITHGGAKGDVEVLDVLGNTRTDLRTYVFDNGPAMLVGVLPDKTVADPPGEEFILKLDRKMHAYNVRQQTYLGYTDMVAAGILPAQAKLLALLPARVEDGLVVKIGKQDYRPGDAVAVEIATIPAALQHVALAVRLEVLQDNHVIAAYTKKLAVKGVTSHHIPLALNQKKGEYTLRLTEVISGQQQELRFTVR